MKHKIFGLFLALILCSTAVQASDKNRLPHRISASYTEALWPQVWMGTGSFLTHMISLGTASVSNMQCPGGFNVGYQFISKSERWGYGLNLGYTPMSYDMKVLGVTTRETINLLGIMPTVECYYIKKGIVRLYGSLGVGVNVGFTNTEVAVGIDTQFNPIAMRVGTNRIAGFFSVGIGTRGIFGLGLQVGL